MLILIRAATGLKGKTKATCCRIAIRAAAERMPQDCSGILGLTGTELGATHEDNGTSCRRLVEVSKAWLLALWHGSCRLSLFLAGQLGEDFLRNLIRRRIPRSALRLCAAMGDCGMLTGQLCQLRRASHARQYLLQGLASWLVTRTRISEHLGILSSLLLITSSKWHQVKVGCQQ